MQQEVGAQAGTVRAPEHHNAHPGKVLPLGSRAGWSSRRPSMWDSDYKRPKITSQRFVPDIY
jgi:hypothetical protein